MTGIMNIVNALLTLILIVHSSHSLRYLNQTDIPPISPVLFAAGGEQGNDIQLTEVKKKGSLRKWRQKFNGVEIFGSVVTTRSDQNGMIIRKEGFIQDFPTHLETTPKILVEKATELLQIEWNHIGMENINWKHDEPELYILPGDNGTSQLVWLISYNVEQDNGGVRERGYGPVPSRIIGMVNAHNGHIEKTWNAFQDAVMNAIVGNDNIGRSYHRIDVVKKGSKCWHRDEKRRIEVYSAEQRTRTSLADPSDFKCNQAASTDWDKYTSTGGFSPRNEAFLHATYFVDMWKELVGNDNNEPYPSKPDGAYFEVTTHFGKKIAYARFDGSNGFLFGDGDGRYYPMTSLDLVCHEIGHSVTLWHGAGKMVSFGEPGAINEAYSDILGETCDMHFKNKTDYLIGGDIMKPNKGKAIRDMCNPSTLGGLDHYSEFKKSTKIHDSAGIYDRAWCILSKTEGWGYVNAFQVFNDANLMRWGELITMHCGACVVESAASDRSLDKSHVREAFGAVGVYCYLCK